MHNKPPTTSPLSPPSHTPVTTSPPPPPLPRAAAPAIPIGHLSHTLPRDFYDLYWRRVTGLARDEIHILSDPDDDRYWDTWKRVLQHGKVSLHNTTYTMWINPFSDDCYLVRTGYIYNEDTDTWSAPAQQPAR